MDVTIYPSQVAGRCRVPPSKSHTMRAILLASLAHGQSRLKRVLLSPDTEAMIQACRQLGAGLDWEADGLLIHGCGGRPLPHGEIDCGNSGQVLRFVAAIGALAGHPFRMTGDASIRSRRPVHALIDALQQGKVSVDGCQGRPPLEICGPLRPGMFRMHGADSQPVSALLMACSLMEGPSTLSVTDLGERPWVGLTIWWLERLGARIKWHRENVQDRFEVEGGLVIDPLNDQIPADWSSAAFPMMAGLLAGGSSSSGLEAGVRVEGLLPDDPQGDKELVSFLTRMGAKISWREGALQVLPSELRGGRIDANSIIDAVPILAAAGPWMEEGIFLENVAMARLKESDRLEAMAEGIRILGGRVTHGHDWIQVLPGSLRGGEVLAHHDHRIAMAFAVAALRAREPVTIRGCGCVAKSFPGFFSMLEQLGARVTQEPTHATFA